MPKVLLVEDDDSIATALKDGFEYEGFNVVHAADGEKGLSMASGESPDLIILDVMLPKMNGHDVCRQIRKDGNNVPIIMLTARGQEIDKVLGLKLGADDYVTKPFGFMELMARVEALLRRAVGRDVVLETYQFGNVSVDFKKGEANKKGTVARSVGARAAPAAVFRRAPRRGGRPGAVARRGVGLRQRPPDPHRRHARRQAAQEDRGHPGGPALHHHGPPHGLQVQRLNRNG